MPKFRKKPIEIDAVQWNGKNFDEIMNFMNEFHGSKLNYENAEQRALKTGIITITTMHDGQHVNVAPGDWIVPDGKPNTFYPIKSDVFEKTYEHVGDEYLTKNLTFGRAINAAKYYGEKVARYGWNASGMYAYIVPDGSYPAVTEIAKKEFGEMVPYRAYWALKTAQGDVATWAPSSSDSLAEDWYIVE